MIDLPYAEVIGDPIAHSKSPLIHRFWLAALGIDAEYRATHVLPGQLGAYFANRRDDPAWRGCNVTIPHKLAVLDHVADPGDIRSGIGAANCVFRDAAGAWSATNTDAAGFRAPIAGMDLAGRPAVVVGAGGAARAVLWTLARMGAGPVTILARDPAKAAGLLAAFALEGEALEMGAPVPPDARLLVNASSLGMTGQPPLTIDLSPLAPDAVVYDLVYAPVETPLLAAARARGLAAVDGLDMLVGQAATAFALFFGSPPPRDRDDALRAALLA
jgi:shikimate dehydrogenase